ncbi:oxygen-independent coproporphyrinogen-3 oxidase [Rhizobiales bacterium GAS191]|nr:oxygen-independent coproporphyrinogen-3 oxidase [Rhizobiales bacterium GAS191]
MSMAETTRNVRPPAHATQDAGFGVYVHWPFCLAKCPYCDFNSHVRHAPPDQARFVKAFQAELAHMQEIAPGRMVTSIFFGGGTPSLMEPGTVGAILDAIAQNWSVDRDVEVTLEANPTSVEAGRFRGYREAGVNRVSLGVQALNDADLKALGRMHTVEEAMRAVGVATSLFERSSFDLIYARPGQSPDAWRAELEEAIARAGEHMSLYQLTFEPDTPFEALRRAGKLQPPPPEEARILYEITQELCSLRGLPAYEVSNHARPGQECRHNLTYWRYGEYAGVGPGAHGRLVAPRGRLALSTERAPESWVERALAQGHGVVDRNVLLPADEGDEFLLMGLRLGEGIDPQRFAALAGRELAPERIELLTSLGLVEASEGRLRVTQEGFLVLDAVVADLAA